MKKSLGRYIIVFLLSIHVLSAAHAKSRPQPFDAKVIGVSDGDTISILKSGAPVKIRLHGIDCPETGQDFGTKAKRRTSDLVFGGIVTISPVDTDRYGRTVARVRLKNGKDLHQILVGEGLCWWSDKYAPNDETLRALQARARAEKLGLWSRPDAVAPWAWRRQRKAAHAGTLAR